ncbi:sulfurtransferase complex subunit TusC [Salinicola endophyticus]|uniref:Sulfurtransferase complex subunit TusC n=1 Tax=Salinicola endophyticus TaxID=1949083 RepID=A0ABY8FJ94_9GAMM|nr:MULTISPECIES: sulfurtransferase complex subunit TusC [Salinicola]WFF42875.1 sulfurtransferase complex subunit TusC [Salinicola endophyticus]
MTDDETAPAADTQPISLDLLVILRHPPHGSSWLREGVDVALVAAAFGQAVGLLFQGDGVFALVEGQGAGPLGQKGTHAQLAMLEMYDIERLWVSASALRARGLTLADLALPALALEADEIDHLVHAQPRTLLF